MYTISIILFSVAILLFLLSFFQKDSTKQVKEELEQLSLNMLQEQYSLKKRMQILEEELFISNDPLDFSTSEQVKPNKIIMNQVISLANQGLPIMQISKQSALPIEVIEEIISGRMK